MTKNVPTFARNNISSLGSAISEITLVTKQAMLKGSGTKIELVRWLVKVISEIMSKA